MYFFLSRNCKVVPKLGENENVLFFFRISMYGNSINDKIHPPMPSLLLTVNIIKVPLLLVQNALLPLVVNPY